MLIPRLMRLFFNWLYHPLAFTYDLVAATVSLGQWNEWGRSVIPLIEGRRVLELGHGPGYLQRTLRGMGLQAAGLDESPQMGRLARRRLRAAGCRDVDLVRALAQSLPFAAGSFDTLVSTFPSEYIFDPITLAEARRVLEQKGRLVVLPFAWPANRLLKWLFRFTGETPAHAIETVQTRLSQPFVKAGFQTETRVLDVKSGTLLIIIATQG